ncbi:MAG: cytochrome c oxidase assembly protein [Chloroflexota bacterium]|nr:cytochrome c oxidase assembly protein [Chloroflexota bacterium]
MTLWTWDPSVVAGCAALVAIYFWAVRGRLTRPAFFFLSGVLVLLLALVSPIDELGDEYLFSAHMLQHLLLVLVVPPLLVAGTPRAVFRRILAWPLAARLESIVRQPLVAWTLAVGTLCVWHIPFLYNAALADEGVHIVQHLSFLVTSTIFWWPVLSPMKERRYAALPAVAYLFVAALANMVLGIYLTFVPPGLYPAYLRPGDAAGVLWLVRTEWGLSPAADQQLGGLLMWVPGGLAYLGAIFIVLVRWYSAPEAEAEDALPASGGVQVAVPATRSWMEES